MICARVVLISILLLKVRARRPMLQLLLNGRHGELLTLFLSLSSRSFRRAFGSKHHRASNGNTMLSLARLAETPRPRALGAVPALPTDPLRCNFGRAQ
jgi:hypothetical protein